MFGKELIVYNSLNKNELFSDFMRIMEPGGAASSLKEDRILFCNCINRLMNYCANKGFYGNLFHCFVTDLLVNDENFYALGAEKHSFPGQDGLNIMRGLLEKDFLLIKRILDFDFEELMSACRMEGLEVVFNMDGFDAGRKSPYYNRVVRDGIVKLARDLASCEGYGDMALLITDFYRDFGVGEIGLHKAFRLITDENDPDIVAIRNITHVHFDDLYGYESAKRALRDNTEAFLRGDPANNCLLYGDSGTGKSTSIKALANEYYSRGLRIIEVYRHQFKYLHRCMGLIKNRNYKFIIYLDDLSFEDFETDYKYLKAVIEGGLEVRPDNILIYATSNRRHLVRESFSDRKDFDDDLHANDTVQEKTSLASRFGTTIYYGSPDRKEYYDIVRNLAEKEGIDLDEKELLAGADRFEIKGGGRSGRCARQYIDTLLCKGEV